MLLLSVISVCLRRLCSTCKQKSVCKNKNDNKSLLHLSARAAACDWLTRTLLFAAAVCVTPSTQVMMSLPEWSHDACQQIKGFLLLLLSALSKFEVSWHLDSALIQTSGRLFGLQSSINQLIDLSVSTALCVCVFDWFPWWFHGFRSKRESEENRRVFPETNTNRVLAAVAGWWHHL